MACEFPVAVKAKLMLTCYTVTLFAFLLTLLVCAVLETFSALRVGFVLWWCAL